MKESSVIKIYFSKLGFKYKNCSTKETFRIYLKNQVGLVLSTVKETVIIIEGNNRLSKGALMSDQKIQLFLFVFFFTYSISASEKCPDQEQLSYQPMSASGINFATQLSNLCTNTSPELVSNGFGTDYVSQAESSIGEAVSLLSPSELDREIGVVLHERPPDDLNRPEYKDLIKNKEKVTGVSGYPHGRGTLGILAADAPTSPGTTKGVSVFLTANSDPKNLLELLTELKAAGKLPQIINGSHGSFGLGAESKEEEIKTVLNFICENKILLVLAAGNGKEVKLPEKNKSCIISATSLDASLRKSKRASSGDHVTVSVMSDKYQKSLGMYHGWTSGAAPLISSAMILVKKVVPEATPEEIKVLLAASSDPLPPLPSPNDQTGYGKLNAPKLVIMAKLLKMGKLSRPLVLLPEKIAAIKNTFDNYRESKDGKSLPLFYSSSEAQSVFQKLTNCQQIMSYLKKLKLSYFLSVGSKQEADLKKELVSIYSLLGNFHQAALLFRNAGGKLDPTLAIKSKLLSEVNIGGLAQEDYIKYVDLLSGLELNDSEKTILKKKFNSILGQPASGADKDVLSGSGGVPKEKFALEMLKEQLGNEFSSFITPVFQSNPQLSEWYSKSQKK